MFDRERLAEITRRRGEWLRRSDRQQEIKPAFSTQSGLSVGRCYGPADVAGLDYLRDLGDPGEFPFTRGVHATGYRGKLWTMRMFAGFGSAEETNQRFRYLLEHGQTGLSVAFDLPTLMGRDTDDPLAEGEYGTCGVAISSLADLEILFDRIPLDQVTTSMTISSPAAPIWAMYLVLAEQRGIPWEQLRGTIQNDILKEFIAQNEYIFPPGPSMRLVVDTFEFGSRHVPQWNTISVSGYHIREAGATAVQELAFTLADGFAYVQAGIDRGLDVDGFAPRISFFWDLHNDFFEEVAKFRAARRIWARAMQDRFGAQNPKSWLLRTHAQTAGCSLPAQQPEINPVRVAYQALAAVLGGTQSLHTCSLDEALALPSDYAVKIALRTQQILAYETGVTSTVDPLGGSYFIEDLTNRMEAAAEEYFRKIEALGGVTPAIEKGFFQREIHQSAYRYQQEIDRKERIIVGVNEFVEQEEPAIPILRIDPEGERRHLERLSRLRQERDGVAVSAALDRLARAAEESENLMPYLIEAVRAYATLGEVCGVLRQVFGEYREQWAA